MEAFDNRPVSYDPDEIAIAGVFVTIGASGSLSVDRGYVRPADERPADGVDDETQQEVIDPETGEIQTPAIQRTIITIGGQAAPNDDEEEEGSIKPLPERLVIELTTHRTLALRNALAENPHVAMTMLLHKLLSDTFIHTNPTGCLEANVRHTFFSAQSEELKDSPSAKAVNDRHERWGDHVPADDQALWHWLTDLDDGTRMELLALCVSYGVNALFERPNPYSGSGVSQHGLDVRLAQADRLARATGLDMVTAGWKPTVGNYLGRVTKPHILAAVREGVGERAAQRIEHMKKGDMAIEAERLLANTGWLPESLRASSTEPVGEQTTVRGDETAIDDTETPAEDELADDAPHAIAAE